MKKLLILMLVLGMASMASAALQISIDGNPEPIDSQIVLLPSETIELYIWTTTEIKGIETQFAGFALVVDWADATLTGGNSLLVDAGISINPVPPGAKDVGFPGLLAGEDGPWGMIGLLELPSIPAGTVIFDDIIFHCERAPNDVVIRLLSTQDWMNANIEDTAIIHQIPEPATMLLLGLGGLLLRRRK